MLSPSQDFYLDFGIKMAVWRNRDYSYDIFLLFFCLFFLQSYISSLMCCQLWLEISQSIISRDDKPSYRLPEHIDDHRIQSSLYFSLCHNHFMVINQVSLMSKYSNSEYVFHINLNFLPRNCESYSIADFN